MASTLRRAVIQSTQKLISAMGVAASKADLVFAARRIGGGGETNKPWQQPEFWKRLTLFVALPAMGFGMLSAYLAQRGHVPKRPDFVPYEYMRVRTKRFPWGDGQKTLFHNPEVNALPTGYEQVQH